MSGKATSHQSEVLVRLYKMCTRSGFMRSIDERKIGSRGALAHLMQKGYIEIVSVERGPRGGTTRFFRPTEKGARSALRKVNATKEP